MKCHVKIPVAIIAALIAAIAAYGAPQQPDDSGGAELKRVRQKVFRGKYHTVIDGDTVMMLVFNEIDVYPPLRFKNKKEEEFYWRTVRDVRKALPYAKLIAETLTETYEYLQTVEAEKERKAYLKKMQREDAKQ